MSQYYPLCVSAAVVVVQDGASEKKTEVRLGSQRPQRRPLPGRGSRHLRGVLRVPFPQPCPHDDEVRIIYFLENLP